MMPAVAYFLGLAAVVAVGAAVAVRLVLGLALKRALLDMPNERSSHQRPVPRLGGAAFMPVVLAALVWCGLRGGIPAGLLAGWLGGAAALFALSLADDFFTLPSGFRLLVQAATALVFLACIRQHWPGPFQPAPGLAGIVLHPGTPGFWCLALWIVGVVNLYNFMDGIDGIAGLQAVVAGGAWLVIGVAGAMPLAAAIGATVLGGALGFLAFNWSPAKIFMGDAGSTVLGYLLATAPLIGVVEARAVTRASDLLVFAAVVLWPFLLDGAFTLLRRIRRRENILVAHRSHLYQRLTIAGWTHARVTRLYGGLALLGAGLAGATLLAGTPAMEWTLAAVALAFGGLWARTVRAEQAARRR